MKTTEEIFREWWAESYPGVKPSPHSVMTHVAFSDHMDSVRERALMEWMSGDDGGAGDS